MEPDKLPVWAQIIAGMIIVVASTTAAVWGHIRKPETERVKVEGQEITGASRSLDRAADALEDIRDMLKTFLDRQAHSAETKAIMDAVEARLAVALKPSRRRTASKRKTPPAE